MSSEIKRVFAQISENEVTEGFYKLKGNVLTMVWYPDGEPVLLGDAPVTAKVQPGANPDAVARMLAKRIRKAFRGETVEGFNRRLEYTRERF